MLRSTKRRLAMAGALLCATLTTFLYSTHSASASNHQDAPLTTSRPGLSITDVFVFPANDPKKVDLAMDVWPLIPSGLGTHTYFDPGVLYQLKIAFGQHRTEDRVIQFKADTGDASQHISVYGPAAPEQTGTKTTILASSAGAAAYNQVTQLPGGISVFAGPREDPFYFDLAQFFRIQPDRSFMNQPNPPANSAICFRKNSHDFLAGYNVLSLVIEMPRTMLADNGKLGRINVWATSSLKSTDPNEANASSQFTLANVAKSAGSVFGQATDTSGTWDQVERLGRPAVKEATEAYANHDTTNRSTLTDDQLLADSIRHYMIHTAGRSTQIADAAVKILIPDYIEADLSRKGPARYLAVETSGKSGLPVAVVRTVPPDGIEGLKKFIFDPVRRFGGRDPKSPVIDLDLGAVFGSLIPKLGFAPDDHRETPCLTSDHVTGAAKHPLKNFPYIGEPR